MSRLVLWKEVQPFVITQRWGVYDPVTYGPFGFSRHNGNDCQHGYNSRVRAPFPYQVYKTLWQPEGGGLVLSIVSLEKYDFDDGVTCNVLIDYLHLAKYVKTQGQGDIGDLLCIAGNSGAASTGPHTHMQARRVKKSGSNWVDIDKNDANGSFDQLPYYTAGFAVDYKKPAVTIEDTVGLVVSQAKESIPQIAYAPEPEKSTLLALWETVLSTLSKLLTKG